MKRKIAYAHLPEISNVITFGGGDENGEFCVTFVNTASEMGGAAELSGEELTSEEAFRFLWNKIHGMSREELLKAQAMLEDEMARSGKN